MNYYIDFLSKVNYIVKSRLPLREKVARRSDSEAEPDEGGLSEVINRTRYHIPSMPAKAGDLVTRACFVGHGRAHRHRR
jgi:hypothetical protein